MKSQLNHRQRKFFHVLRNREREKKWLGTNNNKGWVLTRFSSKKIFKYHFFLRKRPSFNFQIKPHLGYPVNFSKPSFKFAPKSFVYPPYSFYGTFNFGEIIRRLCICMEAIFSSFPYAYEATVSKTSKMVSVTFLPKNAGFSFVQEMMLWHYF